MNAMVVDIFEDDSVSRRQLVAKTRLLVNNKPAPGEARHVSETWRVISAYRAANPKVQNGTPACVGPPAAEHPRLRNAPVIAAGSGVTATG